MRRPVAIMALACLCAMGGPGRAAAAKPGAVRLMQAERALADALKQRNVQALAAGLEACGQEDTLDALQVVLKYYAAAEDLQRGIAVVFARFDVLAQRFTPGAIDWGAVPSGDKGGVDVARAAARAGGFCYLNDIAVASMHHWPDSLANELAHLKSHPRVWITHLKPGQEARLRLLREHSEMQLNVRVERRPAQSRNGRE